ncbi:two-component system heavy metal sensor histidine kinase CusS [Tahibacter aquaticus]|uniref:Sensor protein n=1 Tax=Tahibacter aquaticus TaxID=520092 RepID=A0A4R6Z219_9GAMM|nr:heavy metal sensor histidine kinase [Tahibacter aquaticus]TDR45638.1 two-component system heavy metal sensor histidine kinase CusS [Tahibacter aquaticus]
MTRLPPLSSIAWRITLLYTTLAAGIFITVALLIHASVEHHFESQDRKAWEGKLELVGHILETWRTPANDELIFRTLADAMVGHHSLLVRVEDPAGTFRFASGHAEIPVGPGAWRPARDANVPFQPIAWDGANASFRGVVTWVPTGSKGHDMLVYLASDTSHHQDFLTSFDYQLALICGIALLLMSVLAWVATRRGLLPIRDMADVAESISAQRLHQRLSDAEIPVELRPLAQAFNAMLDRLSDALQRLTDFSSDLAHELRTPISNLMMQTQVSLSKPRRAEDYREILYSNLEEYEHLARMIADMLFLAKADHGLIIPSREVVTLSSEVAALFEYYDALASERRVGLVQHGEGHIHGDRVMLRRALGNLLTNAIRYTPDGGAIVVCVSTSTSAVTITIENPGPTIPPDQIVRIFDRFYRGNASRQRTEEGAGLGLAICQSIVQAHGGDVSVVSFGGITRFAVQFPADAKEGHIPSFAA